jgi:hypothetical protein
VRLVGSTTGPAPWRRCDRTPGAYDVHLRHVYTGSNWDRQLRIFVTPGGEVEIAEVRTGGGDVGVDVPATPQATQRCTLRDAAYFEQCMGYLESIPDPQGDYGSYPADVDSYFFTWISESVPWFVDCQPLSPTCE